MYTLQRKNYWTYIWNTVTGSNDGAYVEFEDLNTEQRQRLLDTTEQIEEAGKHLANGYRIAIETEELGAKVLQDLHAQRETIKSSLNRVSIIQRIMNYRR